MSNAARLEVHASIPRYLRERLPAFISSRVAGPLEGYEGMVTETVNKLFGNEFAAHKEGIFTPVEDINTNRLQGSSKVSAIPQQIAVLMTGMDSLSNSV